MFSVVDYSNEWPKTACYSSNPIYNSLSNPNNGSCEYHAIQSFETLNPPPPRDQRDLSI